MEADSNKSERRTLRARLFGNDLKSGKAWSVFALRMALGFMFLYGGYEKIVTELGGGYATTGFLASRKGPLAFLFVGMSGNPAVEYLLVYGELLIGLSIMLGVVTRIGSISGALLSALLYLSQMPAMPAKFAGGYFSYLLENNALINQYIIFTLVFVAFVFLMPGRFLGLDGFLQKTSFVESRPQLNKIAATLG